MWDYVGDNYVHRLIMNKDDGKLVEIGRSFGLGDEEKVESLAMEYTFLLTQQVCLLIEFTKHTSRNSYFIYSRVITKPYEP